MYSVCSGCVLIEMGIRTEDVGAVDAAVVVSLAKSLALTLNLLLDADIIFPSVG
jgi:hypothetical protein